jgi:transcriptional regulator with XRE-family HTH domain
VNGVDTCRALLRRHREAQGLTLTALADLAGLDKSIISKIESGQRGPTAYNLDRLCRALTLDTGARDALYLAARLLPPGLPVRTLARLVAAVRVGDLRLLTEDADLLDAALTLAREARRAATIETTALAAD